MWPDSPETARLLAEAQDRHPGAEDRLLARHREPLRRMIALRLDPALAGRLDASDVVQEVLLEAHRRLTEYLSKPAMPFHLWLRQLAQDHLIDAHRRHHAQKRDLGREQPLQGRAPNHSSLELAVQLLDPELTPASAAVRQELERRLHEALAGLDEEDREVLLLRHFEQLANQDVATVLGLSEPAASMRYLRALRRLRQRLVAV